MAWSCSDKLATPFTRPPGSEFAATPVTSAPLGAITNPWTTNGALRLAWNGSPVFSVLVDIDVTVRTLILLPAGTLKVLGLGGGGFGAGVCATCAGSPVWAGTADPPACAVETGGGVPGFWGAGLGVADGF